MKIKHYILMTNIVITFIGMSVFSYLYFVDGTFAPVLDVTSMHTVKETYGRGEMVKVDISFCKNRDIGVSHQWSLVDDDVPPVIYNKKDTPGVDVGCYTDRISDVEIIPKYVSPGVYHFENDISYQINPLKRVEYVIKTNTFIIK